MALSLIEGWGGETEEWGKDEGVGRGKGEEEGKAYLAEQKKNKRRVTDGNRGYGGKQVAEGGKKIEGEKKWLSHLEEVGGRGGARRGANYLALIWR